MRIHLPETNESVVLDGVTWEEFEAILEELGETRARQVSYDGVAYDGRLEVMSPLQPHGRVAALLALLLGHLAEEFGLETMAVGSWTLKRAGLKRAVEGDATFYVGDEARILTLHGGLDLARDPPPDIVIEVDVTHKSLPRFPIYADLGVPEIWRYEDGVLEVWQLRGKEYAHTDGSHVFPGFPVPELARFVDRGLRVEVGDRRLVREFRDWVREIGSDSGQ